MGPTGATGTAGVSGLETNSSSTTNSSDKSITVACATPSKSAMSGGYRVSASSGSDVAKVAVVENYPSGGNQWTIRAVETSQIPGNWTLTAYIICASA